MIDSSGMPAAPVPGSGLFSYLAQRPLLLFAACFLANAICLPYQGLFHDAELYATQVVHADTGRHANDLFFRSGSQSDYTVLPGLLAAPARWLGVEPLFFLAYVLSNAARLWVTQRLAFRLFGRTPLVAAGVLLAAVSRIPLGSENIFLVNEPFFTARVPALAAAIAGLERALAGRSLAAAGLFAVGAAIHPLMTAPAVAVATAWPARGWATTPRRRAGLAAGALLAAAAVGGYLVTKTGGIDAEWRRHLDAKNDYLDPVKWSGGDWLRLTVAGGVAAWLAGRLGDAARGRFLWLLVLAAAAGVVGSVVAARGSWVLLMQVQTYRAVWPLELVRLPAVLLVVGHLWAGGPERRLLAVGLVILALAAPQLFLPAAGVVFVACVAATLLVLRVAAGEGAVPLWQPLAAGVALWAVVWYGWFATAAVRAMVESGVMGAFPWPDRLQMVGNQYGTPVRAAVGVLAAAGLVTLSARRPRTAVGAGTVAGLAVTAGLFVVPATDSVADRAFPQRANARFVRGVLAERWQGAGAPTVYWSCGPLRHVWTDLGANSYWHLNQLSGGTFSRDVAVEGGRRAGLVLPFEVERLRQEVGSHGDLIGLRFEGLEHRPRPTAEQFRALVADPPVDFVILSIDFGGAAATNGSVYVYDCRALRAAAGSHPDGLPLPAREPGEQ